MNVTGSALKVVVPRVAPTRALEERARLGARERELAAHSLHYLCLMRDEMATTTASNVPTSFAAPAHARATPAQAQAQASGGRGAGERLEMSEAALNKAAYLSHRYNPAPAGFPPHYPTALRSRSNPPAGDTFDALQQRARTLVCIVLYCTVLYIICLILLFVQDRIMAIREFRLSRCSRTRCSLKRPASRLRRRIELT